MKLTIYDLSLVKDISCLKSETANLVLYGAGQCGQRALRLLREAKISVLAFCNMNYRKWGTELSGVPILSPAMLKRKMESPSPSIEPLYIIACVHRLDEAYYLIREFFSDAESLTIRFITQFALETACYFHRHELFQSNSPMSRLYLMEKSKYELLLASMIIDRLNGSSDFDTFWIFQPGKVGSLSICCMLQNIGVPICHFHSIIYPEHIFGKALEQSWNDVVSSFQTRKIKIITAVREPLARDYSAFWEAFGQGMFPIGWYISAFQSSGGDFQKMYQTFIKIVLSDDLPRMRKENGKEIPDFWIDEFHWFDEQILNLFHIDIYAYPFDRERGFGIIHADNADIFIYKMEKLNELEAELSRFVGHSLKIAREHDSEQRPYAITYREFRKRVRLPAEYVNHYYVGNAKMDHFYTPEEKAAFLKQWEGNIVRD